MDRTVLRRKTKPLSERLVSSLIFDRLKSLLVNPLPAMFSIAYYGYTHYARNQLSSDKAVMLLFGLLLALMMLFKKHVREFNSKFYKSLSKSQKKIWNVLVLIFVLAGLGGYFLIIVDGWFNDLAMAVGLLPIDSRLAGIYIVEASVYLLLAFGTLILLKALRRKFLR